MTVTNAWSGLGPVEFDTAYVARYGDLAKAQQSLGYAAGKVHDAAGDRLGRHGGDYRTPSHWGMRIGEAIEAAIQRDRSAGIATGGRGERAVDAYTDACRAVNLIVDDLLAMDSWYLADPWSRFWLVRDGHLHSSTGCSTCNKMGKATQFALIPALSGSTETDAVAEYGSMLCTVCYPTAPVEHTDGSIEGRIPREAREAKAAEKAAKLAAKLEKALLPDGSELRLQGYDRPKTLIAGQRALSAALGNIGFYGPGHPDAARWASDARTLADAIAAKTGGNSLTVLAEAAKKAAAKARRDGGRYQDADSIMSVVLDVVR